MSNGDEPRPGTNAAIEYRIGKLEVEQSKIVSDMALVKLEQQHQREIMTGRFGAIDASLIALTIKLDRFLEILSAGTQDVLGSPAGRVLDADIRALAAEVKMLKSNDDRHAGALNMARFLAAGGLLSGVVALWLRLSGGQ